MTTNNHSLEGLAQWLRVKAQPPECYDSDARAEILAWADAVEAASFPRGDVEGLMALVSKFGDRCWSQGLSEGNFDRAGVWQTSLDADETCAEIRALASRLAVPPSIPEGYVLVPKEPTREMLLASYHPKVNSDERAEIYSAMIAAAPQPQPAGVPQEVKRLWLWKNFVDGRPEYWAFDNPYPTNMDNADPQTLGEPCGWAIFKPSRDGSCGRTEESVMRTVMRLANPPSAPTAQPAEAPEHVCGLQGYNPMIDPPCPVCEANNAGRTIPAASSPETKSQQ